MKPFWILGSTAGNRRLGAGDGGERRFPTYPVSAPGSWMVLRLSSGKTAVPDSLNDCFVRDNSKDT